MAKMGSGKRAMEAVRKKRSKQADKFMSSLIKALIPKKGRKKRKKW